MSFRHLSNSRLACLVGRALLLILCADCSIRAQFRFDSWTTEEGLPQNSVFSIRQTGDGYLWMGTYEGLARFDGVNFKVFDNTNTPGLKNNWVKSVAEDRAGNLWAGTDGSGLFRRDGDELRRDPQSEALPSLRIMTLFADRAGFLWVGTQKGLSCRRGDGELTNFTVRDGLPSDFIRALAEDDTGALWIGTNKGLARLRNGKFTVYRQADGLTNETINALAWSATDGLWIGTDKGLNRWQNERLVDFGTKSQIADYWIMSLAARRDGSLWIGTWVNGLLRLGAGAAAATAAEVIKHSPDERILAIHQDSEGALWFGGAGSGLGRLKSGQFQTLWRDEGVREDYITAVFEDRAHRLWFSTDKTLYRLTGDNLEIHPQPVGGDFYAMAEDQNGTLWLASYRDTGKIWRLQNNKFTSLTVADGLPSSRINSIISDRAGDVWIGTGDGLAVFHDGRFTIFKTTDGLIGNQINLLYEASDGALWVGTASGVSRFQNGRFTNWTTNDGLSSNLITSFYEADNGALWIGTETGGLNRYKNGKFATVTTQNGLYDNLVNQILEANGDLWMSGNKGIYRVNFRELNDFADGRIAAVTSYAYGTADGMLSRECTGAGRAGWRTQDGNLLWFPTVKGLVKIDVQKRNSPPPSVLIEKIRVDGQMLPIDQPLQIKPEQENLEIDYTALSWERPRHIKFKYRLENLDSDWTNAANRRTAYYTHLPAGEYTFRVIADNGDGVWNMEGRSLRVSVLPPFYQTRWFYALCILAIGGAAFGVYKIRVNRLERARFAQEEFSRKLINAHESERRRIAAELHDSLGQHLAMIKNSAVFGSQTAGDLNEAREHLEEISAQSAQAIGEVREIAFNLRPYLIERVGLTKAVESLLEKIEDNSALEIVSEIQDIDNVFEPESETGIYRIIQESLNNILKHAEASQVIVSIKSDARRTRIKIEDDGSGFDMNAKTENGKRGGFGLLGMAERVRLLGGTIQIDSAPLAGTTVKIELWKHR